MVKKGYWQGGCYSFPAANRQCNLGQLHQGLIDRKNNPLRQPIGEGAFFRKNKIESFC